MAFPPCRAVSLMTDVRGGWVGAVSLFSLLFLTGPFHILLAAWGQVTPFHLMSSRSFPERWQPCFPEATLLSAFLSRGDCRSSRELKSETGGENARVPRSLMPQRGYR